MPLRMTIDTKTSPNVDVHVTVLPYRRPQHLRNRRLQHLRVYWHKDRYKRRKGKAAPLPDLEDHRGVLYPYARVNRPYKIALEHRRPGKAYWVCARLESVDAEEIWDRVCKRSTGQKPAKARRSRRGRRARA